jgi:maltoporin
LVGQNDIDGAHRVRLLDEFVFQPVPSFATAFAAIYETWNPGTADYDSGRWISVGARPTYFFTDHYSLAFQLGASNVKQPGPAGSVASTPLVRATLSPQITPKAEFYSRPSLRAFLTRTFGQETAYGFQGEVWF